MDEDLIGYLLGALDPHEMERIREWLREDPAAREQLVEAERLLRPLEDDYVPTEGVPADLVERTLANLPPLPDLQESDFQESGLQELGQEEEVSGQQAEVEATESLHDPSDQEAQPDVVSLAKAGEVRLMRSRFETLRSRSYRWFDIVGGGAAAAILLALLLSSLAQGRFEARRVACQKQLRDVGVSITQFVSRDEQARLPAVASSGPEAFAGIYAVRLKDAGLLSDADASVRWCPSLDGPGDEDVPFTELNRLPSIEELNDASVDRLRRYQRYSGGHYAYTLGVIEKEQFSSPRFEARASFAVLADAPMSRHLTEDNLGESIGHGGKGINVLYEDGRVDFVSISSLMGVPDHPLFNHRGKVEAGVNIDDASLAPSWRPPFVEVHQR